MRKYQDEQYIMELLRGAENAGDKEITRILDKADNFEGLTPEETAVIISMPAGYDNRLFSIAEKIKKHIYGDRIVMFAPLYVSDYCVNNCVYCGFKNKNKHPRRILSMDEIRAEVDILEKMGHKRLALEAGEDDVNCPLSYILDALKTIYGMKTGGEIRRVNVNIAPLETDGFRRLKQAGIGTYILFQETYHRPTYERVHLSGPKSDYEWHSTAFDRAMEAGIDDVGGGVLFGLYDYRYEALGLMLHNAHLEEKFGVGFHTISLPRIRRAEGMTQTEWEHAVPDDEFLRLTAVLRLAVPFTGMIISTRETPEMRKKLIGCGISQLSGGSAVEVGGYSLREKASAQFRVADERTPQTILQWLMGEDLIPSFCTACYRNGRTGDRFMSLAKSGQIKNVCLPNALMTLAEYAADYGSYEFRKASAGLIERKLKDIPDEELRKRITENISRIESGERDLFV